MAWCIITGKDGYLQWIEADMTDIRLLRSPSAPCPAAERVHALMTAPIPGISFGWIADLGESIFPSVGLFNTKSKRFEIDMSFESFYCLVKLLTCKCYVTMNPFHESCGRLLGIIILQLLFDYETSKIISKIFSSALGDH